jgi:probable rRNA maturation factor
MNSAMAQITDPFYDIDISVQDPAWEDYEDIQDIFLKAIRTTLKTAIFPKEIEGRSLELSLVLANDEVIHVLNREYRGNDKPTNILTFASLDDKDSPLPEEGPVPLGDVMLSYQTIIKESIDEGRFFKDHAIHLAIHGVLHLLGYDHEDEDDANVMESLEIRILESMGVQNPYTETLDR